MFLTRQVIEMSDNDKSRDDSCAFLVGCLTSSLRADSTLREVVDQAARRGRAGRRPYSPGHFACPVIVVVVAGADCTVRNRFLANWRRRRVDTERVQTVSKRRHAPVVLQTPRRTRLRRRRPDFCAIGTIVAICCILLLTYKNGRRRAGKATKKHFPRTNHDKMRQRPFRRGKRFCEKCFAPAVAGQKGEKRRNNGRTRPVFPEFFRQHR